jgi:uncharacterized protein YsxB (DUF464 family)
MVLRKKDMNGHTMKERGREIICADVKSLKIEF